MKKKLLIFLVISIAYILIFPYVKTNIIDKKYIFEIAATGEKNNKSNGTEVWIDSIEADGKEMNMSNLSLIASYYILHQMIAYLRTNFINDSYCNPPFSFYEEVYKVYFILSY